MRGTNNIGHFKVKKHTFGIANPIYGVAPYGYKDQRVAKRGLKKFPVTYRTKTRPFDPAELARSDQRLFANRGGCFMTTPFFN